MPIRKISYLIATGFGSGYFPIASGTAGSLVALIIYIFFPLDPVYWSVITILTFILGVWAAGVVEKDLMKDPGIVVIDEFVGQWIALLFLPKTMWIFIASFLLFRLLDIIKPYPARQVEHLRGGMGIMLDDVFAGIYTNILLQGIVCFI